MAAKFIAVASVLAASQGVWAFTPGRATTTEISWRISQIKVGDACHPEGDWILGEKEEDELIPPCISEQIISWSCEEIIGLSRAKKNETKMIAYRDCLFGVNGSYWRDLEGCLKCKLDNHLHTPDEDTFWNHTFDKAAEFFTNQKPAPIQGFWDALVNVTDFSAYPPVSKGPTRSNGTKFKISDYYRNSPPDRQDVGKFSLDGQDYPKDWSLSATPDQDNQQIGRRDEAVGVKGAKVVRATIRAIDDTVINISADSFSGTD
ncbi:hypothetical protein CDD83_5291 [Cordyceps sp. RAO-2017]|nr:hypothetical protein CDD83_5291 [Cordyceps sp. RAO-2017]